jgi:hypothetical protein
MHAIEPAWTGPIDRLIFLKRAHHEVRHFCGPRHLQQVYDRSSDIGRLNQLFWSIGTTLKFKNSLLPVSSRPAEI